MNFFSVKNYVFFICTVLKLMQMECSIPIVELKQDGPPLESSSYLNVSLRYLGPWDPWTLGPLDLGTLGPWNPWTLGLLDLFPPPTPPHTSPYILLPPPISSS